MNIIGSKITKIAPFLQNILIKDLVTFHRGDSMPVKVSDSLIRRTWRGGEFARWVDDGSGEPTVDIADGRYCGFFLYGSKEPDFKYTVQEESNDTYGITTLAFGGYFEYIALYEQYGYLARHGLGPMIPIVYKSQYNLFVSENGRVTPEDESDFGLFPPHTFPNGDPIIDRFLQFGLCSVPPSTASNYFLGIQTNIGI